MDAVRRMVDDETFEALSMIHSLCKLCRYRKRNIRHRPCRGCKYLSDGLCVVKGCPRDWIQSTKNFEFTRVR